MNDNEIRETIRQMLKDWNAATTEQRQRALRIASLSVGHQSNCASVWDDEHPAPCNCDFAERIRNTRRETLSRMSRPELETEERRAMALVNTRRIAGKRKSKDELIASILYFESQGLII